MYYTSLPELKKIERRNQAARRDAFIRLFRALGKEKSFRKSPKKSRTQRL